MDLNANSLPLIFAAFLLASLGWSLGKAASRWLRQAPGKWQGVGYPTMRRLAFCRLHRHREIHSFRPAKGESPATALWWDKRTTCKDCSAVVRTLEILKDDVPSHARNYLTLSLGGSIFGSMFGYPSVEGDEWKSVE